MTMRRTIFDCTTGLTTEVDFTPEEEAQHQTTTAVLEAELATEDARQAKLQSARPTSAIVTKLHDGTALSAGELQIVVRYLALQLLRETR